MASNAASTATTTAHNHHHADHAVDHGYQEKHVGPGAVSHMDQANLNRFITPGGNPIDNSQPGFPVYHRQFANPAALGMMAFGSTTFILALYNVKARGVVIPNVILGMLLGQGGIVMLLAGMWEFATGNTFAATSISSYAAFFLSFGVLYIPQFEVVASYGTNVVELSNALGVYFTAWFVVSLIFLIAALGSSLVLAGLFFTIMMQFLLLMVAEFQLRPVFQVASGGFGFATAAFAFYVGLASMLTPDTGFFMLPVGDLHPLHPRHKKPLWGKAQR